MGLIPKDIKKELKPMVKDAWDKVRANILFHKNNMDEMMNKGFSLAEAKDMVENS